MLEDVSFKMDQHGAIKKIEDVSFDPLPATSTSVVKTEMRPSNAPITHDECTKMVAEHFKFACIHMQDKLSKFFASFGNKEGNKPEIYFSVFPHDVSTSRSAPIASQPQHGMLFNPLMNKTCIHLLTNSNWLIQQL
jgi:hypothetical protein